MPQVLDEGLPWSSGKDFGGSFMFLSIIQLHYKYPRAFSSDAGTASIESQGISLSSGKHIASLASHRRQEQIVEKQWIFVVCACLQEMKALSERKRLHHACI